jgi:hypothetical protein
MRVRVWAEWRRHSREARAHAAAVAATADMVSQLVHDLEQLRRRNNLAPRIAEAFRRQEPDR